MLSAIVINYKDVALTVLSVEALCAAAQASSIELETIVVDNSWELTGSELSKTLHGIAKVSPTSENIGFAKACNLGAREARGDFLLFINNDAFATPKSLERGMHILVENPEVGIYAPSLTYRDGGPQVSTGRFPTLWGLCTEYLGPYALREKPDRIVETVSGAYMMLRAEVFRSIGGFDEDYFFTSEDVDLCYRLSCSGLGCYYDLDTQVVHWGGASQPWKWLRDPYLHKNRILYFRKHRGIIAAIIAAFIIQLGLAIRFVRQTLSRVKVS